MRIVYRSSAAALDRRVVVELARSLRAASIDLVGADDLALQVPRERRADARIEQPLPRIDVIGGGQLAPLAVERRIVGEIDARPDPMVHVRPPSSICGNAAAVRGTRLYGRAR